MAMRSGGTGVIVGLVVFVLSTVFLLVLTIVFYAGKTEAVEKRAKAESELAIYVRPDQRAGEEAKAIEGAAGSQRQSVYGYLTTQLGDLNAFVSGNRSATPTQLQTDLGMAEGEVVRNVVADLRRQNQTKANEITSLNNRIADLAKQVDEQKSQLAQQDEEHRKELDAVRGSIATYEQAAKDYQADFAKTKELLEQSRLQLEDESRQRIADLQRDNDALRQDNTVKSSRLNELQRIVDAIRVKPRNPAELVDGRIVDIVGNDQVYINLGRKQRVVPGMTFEIFDDANSIQVDDGTGTPRGKASIQVTKVDETTSTARLTRVSPGRPVVKDNVIANAVFDPDYKFKFLVYGKFDVTGDGRPTEAGADFVRNRVKDWGGEVVTGDELTGDLDFLVLGEQPPMPPPLGSNPDEVTFRTHLEQREARDRYDQLFKQAREAQIPVLNWNRFEVLTGTTAR
ncbi:MAG: hypothetical protein KDA22_11430 [Phycisphaerales bacterium]|nr:hypothetical protein [Phycisphaerales bacterium]